MSDYRRAFAPGGCFFFTLATYERRHYFANADNVDRLRAAFQRVKQKHPFSIDAIVILPDHLHTIWRLPADDSNYSSRWHLIKHFVAAGIHTKINRHGEKQVWQRRFWEHVIRDEVDWRNHVDYIHYNPVKHGYAVSPGAWQYSSFSRAVRNGWYGEDWGRFAPVNIAGKDCE